jgi:hypothetical protein
MIRIDFDPSVLAGSEAIWWNAWWTKAQIAIAEARADFLAGTPHAFRQAIWRELKDWLLKNVFAGKCAYCESVITAGFYGDAEHYRPKGKVTHLGTVVSVNGAAHPGYYWLAYHWKNLIPSCQLCNTEAKGTEFEVEVNYLLDAQLEPDDLDKLEQPRLLHPYGPEDPEDFLVFTEFGGIAARDRHPRGEATIRICGLDREDLKYWRHQEQELGWKEFLDLMHQRRTELFESWVRKRPHSAAIIQYVSLKYEEMAPNFRNRPRADRRATKAKRRTHDEAKKRTPKPSRTSN